MTPWPAAGQASLFLTMSQSLLKLMSIVSVMPSSHLSFDAVFSFYPQSLPETGIFPMGWLFKSGDQSTGASASASVLQMNIQDGFPFGWTVWISLLSKGLSGVFSSTTVQRHQFFGAVLFLWSSSHNHT